MKDQFANYVVQKVLETCDDQQREMILTRIKAHLNTLKKYTYGKHIVARVEKLVAAGGMFCCLVLFRFIRRQSSFKTLRANDIYLICCCGCREAPGASTSVHRRLKGRATQLYS